MKNTKYSILELAMVNDNTTHETVFKNSVEVAQKAEELGYHRFWLAEHHNMVSIASSATVVLMGHIAAKTNSIRSEERREGKSVDLGGRRIIKKKRWKDKLYGV